MNELIKELRINEVINALITAFKAGNRDYVSSATELLHEEFTYTVSESTELTGDTLKRASILYALYCLSLGILRLMNNEDLTINPIELLRTSVDNGDLSGLTQSLIIASALLIKGDESWIKNFNELIQGGVNNELFMEILSSFLEVIRVVKAVNP